MWRLFLYVQLFLCERKNGYVLDILWQTKPKNITYFG